MENIIENEKENVNENINIKENIKINKKIVHILTVLGAIIALIILLFLFFASISYTAHFWNEAINQYHEGLFYKKDNIILNIVLVVVLICGIAFINKLFSKTNKNILVILSLLLIGTLGFWWINFVKAPVKSDQDMVLKAATQFSEGTYDIIKGKGYYYMHPLQLGCVLGMELIIKIIGNSAPIALQASNVIFILGSVFILYLITNELYKSENTNRILLILAGATLVLPLYSVVVYGNIYGLFFSFLAILCMLKFYKSYKIKYIFLASIMMAISIIFKSNYEIILIGIIISLFLDFIFKVKVKSLIMIITMLICFSLSYPLVYSIVEYRTGIKVNDGIPMITYIAMSIQKPISRNSGWYHDTNNVEIIYPGTNFDSEKTKEVSMEIIKTRIKEFIKTPKVAKDFYLDKICSTWLEPAYQTFWWSEPLEIFDSQPEEYKEYITNNKLLLSILHGKAKNIITRFLDVMQIAIFLMSVVSIILGIKNKIYTHENIILLVIFVGGFLFHILWETKAIYVIPYYIMLLPSAAHGIELTIDIIKKR